MIVYVGLNIIEHFKGNARQPHRNVLLRRDRDLSGRYYDIKSCPTLILHFSIPHHFRTNYPLPCQDTGYFPEIIWWAFNLLSCVISLVTSFVIVARYNLIIALLTPLFAIPGYLYRKVQIRRSACKRIACA